MIEVGRLAPPFRVVDQDGKSVTEAAFAGRWTVLYFYPKDDTPGCTVEACDFTASIAEFEGLDAQVLGASPDTPESHRKFIAKHGLRVRLLSDPEHRLLEAYGGWGEKVLYGKKSIGVIRSTVIVDPKGVVVHRWARVTAAGHAGFVRAKVAELRAGSSTKAPKAGAVEPTPAKRDASKRERR